MSRRVRLALFVPALLGFAALLFWSFAGLPDFGDYRGPYGFVLNRIVTPERHTTNVVSAVVFDYRGIDTMGEEFILFAAVVGTVLLLRSGGRGKDEAELAETVGSDGVHTWGVLAMPVALVVALWLAAFGYVTPGGGFQGGVAIAGGAAVLYLAHGYRSFRHFGNEEVLDPLEALGAGGFVAIGLAGLIASGTFLHNLLGPGESGTLWSGGSIALLNWAAAIEVAAAMVILFSEFVDQYLVPLAKDAG